MTDGAATPPARTEAGRRYRGALIGFGGVARSAHLPGFRHDAGLRARLDIVAAVDPAPGAAVGADLPVLASREELYTLGALDFVDVCTPTATHLEATVWALERGYHVLCEKPVATTGDEADRIADCARGAGRVVMPCHQYRYNPAWRRMIEWLRAGAIGPWHLAELSVYRPAADAGADRAVRPWRTVRAESGGGILLDHGTHLVYSLLDAAGGEPAAVRAWSGRLRHHEYGVEDTAHVLLEFPDRLATLMLTWAATHRENRVRFMGPQGAIDWQGGVLRLERVGHAPTVEDFSVQLDKRSYPGWFAGLFTAFADALDRGAAPEALADIGRVARVLDAAYRSARTGAAVPID